MAQRIHRGGHSVDAETKRPDEYFLTLVRKFQKEHGRPPRVKDFGAHIGRVVYKRFGTWPAFLTKALGTPSPKWRRWSDEQIFEHLKKRRESLGHFPSTTEIEDESRALKKLILKRFGTLNEALEKALGSSPRIEVLRALEGLTSDSCDRATVTEIADSVRIVIPISQQIVAHTLDRLKRAGMVESGRYNISSWWRLLPGGRELIRTAGSRRR